MSRTTSKHRRRKDVLFNNADQDFYQDLDLTVRNHFTGHRSIKIAICLGLGSPHSKTMSFRTTSRLQLELFLTLVEVLGECQNTKITCIFQDLKSEWKLEKDEPYIQSKRPRALLVTPWKSFQYLDRNSFVYNACAPRKAVRKLLGYLKPDIPALFFGAEWDTGSWWSAETKCVDKAVANGTFQTIELPLSTIKARNSPKLVGIPDVFYWVKSDKATRPASNTERRSLEIRRHSLDTGRGSMDIERRSLNSGRRRSSPDVEARSFRSANQSQVRSRKRRWSLRSGWKVKGARITVGNAL